jgi:23S rRNA (cytosine1962-C5)-methyltransferase
VAKLILKRGREARVLAGHPWVYRGEIAELQGAWRSGEAVSVFAGDGRFLGRGFYNPRPSISCRLLTREDEAIDATFLGRRIGAALHYRRTSGLAGDAFRLVWSEADGLPGLVVDRYGPVTVLQCATLGMAQARRQIVEVLRSLGEASAIYSRDDPGAARIEGFEPHTGWIGEAGPSEIEIGEDRCRFLVDVTGGQKTGFYLDQRENRALVARHARGKRVLDAFCYTGAFACHALVEGAESVLGIERSAEALALARRNLLLNGAETRAELREANAFDDLRRLWRAGERFQLVILDPPPFARRKDALDSAARGYKEINLRALLCLDPGGLLATFSCSHHVSLPLFEEICQSAAVDAGGSVRLLGALTQSRDHPIRLSVPETRYLKGLLLQAAD